MYTENKKYLEIKNKLEQTYLELRGLSAIVGNDVQDSYVKLEILILNTKIEMYEFLINEAKYYNEESIELLKKKLENLKEIQRSKFIIRYNSPNQAVLVEDIKKYKFE